MRLDIAIVGCGPGGLASAAFLRDLGHRVVLYERFDTPHPVGAGLLMQPTGLAVLDRLGLGEAARGLGARIERLVGHAMPSRRPVLDLAYADLAPDLHGLGLHRHALFGLLLAAASERGVPIETGRDIVAAETRAAGRLALLDTVGRATPAFDLVVDASGARSRLRKRVDDHPARAWEYGAVWGTVPLGVATADALEQRYVGARRMLGILPIGRISPGGAAQATIFWSLKAADHAAWLAGDIGEFRADWRAIWPERADMVAGLADRRDLIPATYRQFTAARLSGAALALVGDSGHSTSPQLGQGANMALLDAAGLADALATEPDLPAALERYARLRSTHPRFYQWASAALTPFFQSDSLLAARLRDAAFHPIACLPWPRRQMLATLAGLATGPFTMASAARLAGLRPEARRARAAGASPSM